MMPGVMTGRTTTQYVTGTHRHLDPELVTTSLQPSKYLAAYLKDFTISISSNRPSETPRYFEASAPQQEATHLTRTTTTLFISCITKAIPLSLLLPIAHVAGLRSGCAEHIPRCASDEAWNNDYNDAVNCFCNLVINDGEEYKKGFVRQRNSFVPGKLIIDV